MQGFRKPQRRAQISHLAPFNTHVAQYIEHRSSKPKVASETLAMGTMFDKYTYAILRFRYTDYTQCLILEGGDDTNGYTYTATSISCCVSK